ncbi:Thioredoxin, phage-associated [Fimbriiglobus ruber]|uniref:Thioredoxin, phage-associated n=2 Tax=Fimbriiglobus ruber TaxID=1908690 RepID=A0A225DLU3_9BACT|nr:Thioredoxin, phage-associated [Fimbriiglobus ruber]
MRFGSHVYGTNTPSSDLDFKAVHLPPARDILLQRVKPAISITTKQDQSQRNTAADTDFESFALQKYMSLLLEGQTVALTMLFTPEEWLLESHPVWREIQREKARWLHRGVSAFAGYCRQQANKYGIRGSRVAASRAAMNRFEELIETHGIRTKLKDVWPEVVAFVSEGHEHVAIVEGIHGDGQPVRFLEICNRKIQEHASLKEGHAICKRVFDEYGHRALLAEKNEGVDWKAMMHALRVSREAEELLLYHTITYPRPEAGLLLQVRKGELPYQQVAEMLESGLLRLEECQMLSTLPEKPDYAAAEELVAEMYRERVTA